MARRGEEGAANRPSPDLLGLWPVCISWKKFASRACQAAVWFGIKAAQIGLIRSVTMNQNWRKLMKRLFLATSALVMAGGVAAAEVSVGGDGRMGVISTEGSDIAFTSRIRISFSASGETDGGLTFGGSIRADNAAKSTDAMHNADEENTSSGGGVSGAAGEVYVAGPFGKLSMGDVNSAAKAAVGNADGVGLTGLGDLNEIKYIGKATKPSARWDYAMGNLTLHASADNPGPTDDPVVSGAIAYTIGDVGFGAGVERAGDMQNVAAGVSAALGDASVKLTYGSYDNGMAESDNVDAYGASASFNTGMATFTAFASSNTGGTESGDHFGIGASFDLGGAKITGGFVDGDSLSDGSFDLGVSMAF